MKTAIFPQVTPNDKLLSDILQFYKTIATSLAHQAEQSQSLIELNIKDKLAENIEKFISNPNFVYGDLYNHLKVQMWNEIETLFNSSLKELKPITIKSFYRANNTSDSLVYYIILNNDTEENRDKVSHLLYKYTLGGIDKDFPIDFLYVPLELENKIESATLIA